MSVAEAHPLPNLGVVRKLLATFGLGLGFALFASVWVGLIAVSGWSIDLHQFMGLGHGLDDIRAQSLGTFAVLGGVHLVSLLVLMGVIRYLHDKLALPRGFRVFLRLVAWSLVAFDIGLWLTLGVLEPSRTVLAYYLLFLSVVLGGLAILPVWEMWVFSRWKRDGPVKRVVIVGGGFAGLYTALALDKWLGWHPRLEVTLVDRRNYFLFPPLLPSVATGAIETRQVTYPFRRVFEATNVRFRMEPVERIDLDAKLIHTCVPHTPDPETGAPRWTASAIPYDLLVLSPGSTVNTFNTPGALEHAFFMRELQDAIAFRNHVIDCFEHAAREANVSVQRSLLRFVIVGGGPTGVELAAELQDLIERVLLRRYREINRTFVEVYLIQSGNRLIPGWHDRMADVTEQQLTDLHVKLLLGVRVREVLPNGVLLSTEETIRSRTVVWCAGMKPSPLLDVCELPKERGRVVVEPNLRVKGHSDVYAIGDAAWCPGRDGKPLPALAQVALQQGAHLGKNLVRAVKGKEPRPFRYLNYGALLAVGEHFAVINVMGLRLSGVVAWFVWRALYLVKMVGMANKVRVVIDWTLDLLVERSIAQIRSERGPPAGLVGEAPPEGTAAGK